MLLIDRFNQLEVVSLFCGFSTCLVGLLFTRFSLAFFALAKPLTCDKAFFSIFSSIFFPPVAKPPAIKLGQLPYWAAFEIFPDCRCHATLYRVFILCQTPISLGNSSRLQPLRVAFCRFSGSFRGESLVAHKLYERDGGCELVEGLFRDKNKILPGMWRFCRESGDLRNFLRNMKQ